VQEEFVKAATKAMIKTLKASNGEIDEAFIERLTQALSNVEIKARPNMQCLARVQESIAQMRELTGIDQPVKLDVQTGPAMNWESLVQAVPQEELRDKIADRLRDLGVPPAHDDVVNQPQRALDGPPRRPALPYRPSTNGTGPGGNGH
jgi:hypothetical protein